MSSTLVKYAAAASAEERCLNSSYRAEEKTPTKRSKTPKKTPKGDRFIPSYDLDNELNHYNLTKENAEPNVHVSTPSKAEFTSALENTLFEGKANSKILSFKDKAPAPKTTQSSFPLYTAGSEENAARKTHRHIPTVPEKVLDAPNMSDDYYLNLLDWGNNNMLAVGLADSVYIYNPIAGDVNDLELNLNGGDSVTSVSWIKQGNYLAVGTNNSIVQLWDVERRKKVRSMDGHAARVGALAWNNFVLTSGSRDTNIINHDVRVADHSVSLLAGHSQEVCGLKWSPDGTQLASGGNDNIVNIWDVNNRDIAAPLFTFTQHTAAVKALAWCPFQSNTLATGGGTNDRTIRTWNTITGACLTATPTNSQVCQLMWSTNYRELISAHGFSKNQLTIWKYPTMSRVTDLSGHTSRVSQLAMSPDGETIVSGSADESLRFWKCFQKDQTTVARKATKEAQPSYLANRTIR